MKKLLAIAAVALALAACGSKGTEYQVFSGVTGASGPNCHSFEYNVNPDTLTFLAVADGDSADVTLTINLLRKGEIKGDLEDKWETVSRGRDAADGVEIRLTTDDKGMAAVKGSKENEEFPITFTGRAALADLEKIKGQHAWTTVIMP